MINRNITMATLAIVLLFAVSAFAQMGMGPGGGMMGPGMMGGGPGMMGGGPGYGGNYQLTPEQQKAYQEIVGKYQAQFAKLSEQMWNKHAQLNAVLAQDKVDAAQARSLAKDIGGLAAQTFETRVNMLVDMREKGFSYYGLGMMHGGMMGGPGMMGYGHGYRGGYGYGGAPQ
ncbi:Zinc resistance-associated protein precursor [Pseudodesulfovibrio hydrargyri]|uniref:Zinc resistance-associated protein n=1 Tax=Pseudodesulfovibrio hydrargyri TaxID=2125990 RepID=A0A1J5NG72_9BACT|nr:periplasmic heavy metal sensor [Pseudodesulfovibrio hydrargyri]OIQ50697.1 Zinc resistance-associated protein precursor [Pseudodesulfovibrio hydrargyri]